MVYYIIEGETPTIIGTGAFKKSFIVEGRIGIKLISHLKGNSKEVNA